MSIDSLKDIAVNKLFTIYQNPRGRDFYDIYFILKKQTEWSLEQLIKLARINLILILIIYNLVQILSKLN